MGKHFKHAKPSNPVEVIAPIIILTISILVYSVFCCIYSRSVQPHGPPSLPIGTHLKWKWKGYVCLLDSHTMCKFDVKITGGILRSNSW